MTHAETMAEIERLEEWFRGVCVAPSEVDRSAVRRAVQLAVEEQWLASRLGRGAPEELTDQVKERVRKALRKTLIETEARPRARRGALRLAWWLGGGLSAAAAVALAFVGLRTPGPRSEPEEASISFTTLFEHFEADDLDEGISELREVLLAADQQGDDWGEPWDADQEVSYDGA